ncbi:MAG: adenylate cyclase regulatory domain-containing protein [Solirubrobacteraceae bacterium]
MDSVDDDLFDDLTGDERTQRERLLARLRDDGFTPDELANAARERRLALLPVDRLLGGAYTAAEVEERTGLPAETLIRTRRLQGLPEPAPDERAFSDEDIDAAHSAQLFLTVGFDQGRIDEIARVLGEGMGRLSATITAAFADTFLEAGDGEADVSERFATLAQQLTPATAPILMAAFRAHLRDSVARAVLGREELETGAVVGAQEVAVCFADMVGFTHLGGRVDVGELGTVAGRLASLAASLTVAPVRLIKTIGDAALLVSPEPAPLVAVALELVEAFEREELPSLRAGIAVGPATVHAGDYYGNSVNLASRVTGVARPASVLCTREVRDAAPDGFRWSAAGRHRLKGVSGPTPLYRAHPLPRSPASKRVRKP